MYLSYWTFGPPDYSNILVAFLNDFGTDSQIDNNNLLIAYTNEFGTDSQTDYNKKLNTFIFSHERLVLWFYNIVHM